MNDRHNTQREHPLPERSLLEWSAERHADGATETCSNDVERPYVGRLLRHPLSQVFGDLVPGARQELTERVKQSGAVREIITFDGKVLLDWELYNVALDLGLPVVLKDFLGDDPLSFVVVNCLRQPHWDRGQRAVIAVGLHSWREAGRPGNSVKSTGFAPSSPSSLKAASLGAERASTAEMAKDAQVSPTFITRAKRIREFGLSEAVISGEIKFAEAYRQVRLISAIGLGDVVKHGMADLQTAYEKAKLIADAGLVERVKSGDLTMEKAHHLALAGETGEVEGVRPRRPTKAELVQRVEELERENRYLADAAARATAAEARAAAAEAEVQRLTESLDRAGLAA